MTSHTSARHALRSATAAQHDAVDRAFAGYDLTTRDGYRRFLQAQATAFLPVEAAIDDAGGSAAVPDWTERRRGDLLRADLADLDATVAEDALPPLDGDAAVLGAAYVLEGSRLGGAMLVRGVSGEMPTRFLASPDDRRWRRLTDHIQASLVTEHQRADAIASARAVFAIFEDAARRYARTT